MVKLKSLLYSEKKKNNFKKLDKILNYIKIILEFIFLSHPHQIRKNLNFTHSNRLIVSIVSMSTKKNSKRKNENIFKI